MEKTSQHTVTDLAKELVARVKSVKEEKEIGLNELSALCDINKSQMSKFFNCKINLSFKNVLHILDKLGYEIVITPKENRESIQ